MMPLGENKTEIYIDLWILTLKMYLYKEDGNLYNMKRL